MNTKPANKAFQNSLRTDQYILIQQSGNDAKWHIYVIGVGAGLAGQVLAGPLLSKVKMKLHFCKNKAMNRSASMIFRLVRLMILLCNR